MQMLTSEGVGRGLSIFGLISFPGDSPPQLGEGPLEKVLEVPTIPLVLESVRHSGSKGHPGLSPPSAKLSDGQAGHTCLKANVLGLDMLALCLL